MNTGELDLLNQVVTATRSEVNIFFVIFAVVAIPICWMLLRQKKQQNEFERQKQENQIKREGQIIEVIKANTEAVSGLKATLDINGNSTISAFNRMDSKLDAISADMTQIKISVQKNGGST